MSHASGQFCFKCGTRKEGPCKDPSRHAAWRRTLVDHDDIKGNVAVRGGFLSGVWRVPGFFFDYVQMDSMHRRDLGVAQDCGGNVLFEIFERLGGVAARPPTTTARMKHCMQDAATDLGVELSSTKLQCTSFMKGGLLRIIEIHFPPRDDLDRRVYLCLRCLCLMSHKFYSWSGNRSRQRAWEPYHRHFTHCKSLAGSVCSSTAVAAVAPEGRSISASLVRSEWESSTVLDIR